MSVLVCASDSQNRNLIFFLEGLGAAGLVLNIIVISMSKHSFIEGRWEKERATTYLKTNPPVEPVYQACHVPDLITYQEVCMFDQSACVCLWCHASTDSGPL